ncbi:MAG: hypothetical protein ACKOHM_11375 [Spartobacteria bacterium]
MTLKPKKPASKILIHVGVRKFSGSQIVEEWDSSQGPPIKLSDKIGEYLMRLGDSNSLCLNIMIQLLTRGKVRVDFRDTSERLQLISEQDTTSRAEAVLVFDHYIAENKVKSETPEQTQRIIIETPKVKLPR